MSLKLKEYAILLVIVGFLAYLPSLFGGFVWDDEDFVTANSYVRELKIDKFFTENAIAGRGKSSNYYRPLQFSLYSLLYQISGGKPFIFHLAGILLHLTAGVIIFFTLVHFIPVLPGFLAALFFLLHPVQTESVSYISGLSDQLYTCFFFGSILLFLKAKPLLSKESLLSILFFVLAVLSKELGIILPGILLFITFFKPAAFKKNLPVIIVLFAIAAAYLILRFTVLQFEDISLAWKGSEYGEHFAVRLATFFHMFFLFLSLLVFPKDLFMERDFTLSVMQSLFNMWTFLFILLNAVLLYFLWSHRERKEYRTALLFYMLFVASLVPFTGIFLLNGIFYEHYLYLPMVFFWAAVFAFAAPSLRSRTALAVISVVTVAFILRSYARQWDWIDPERFYRQTLERAPKSVRILNGLGMTLGEKGKCDEALTYYKKALEISPDVPNMYHNAANCFAENGRFDEAEKYYSEALKVNPGFHFSYLSLLDLYLRTGQKEKALTLLEKQILPRYPQNTEFRQLYHQLKLN